MKLTVCIDWLNFTTDRPQEVIPHDHIYSNGMPLRDGKGLHGYDTAYENTFGARIMWHSNRADMGIHTMYPGSALNKYLDAGITARQIAVFHRENHARCTRIDVAIDVVDSQLGILALYELIQCGIYVLPNKRKSALLVSTDGITMYIGSRTSDQFMRVYDKGAEQKTDDNWKRVEIELKGGRAMFFVQILTQDGEQSLAQTARAVIKAMADFPNGTWQLITGEEAISIAKGENRDTDTRTWLITQVAPAMGKYLSKTGDKVLLEQFLSVVAAFTAE